MIQGSDDINEDECLEIEIFVDPEDEIFLDKLREIRTDEEIFYFIDYGVSNFKEIYEYYYGLKTICDCSYELQCAVFDASEEYYNLLVDNYYIVKVAHLRWDKNLEFLILNNK